MADLLKRLLRSFLLAANDGLMLTAGVMIGVGAVNSDAKSMILSGFSELIAGIFDIATREFCSQIEERRSNVKEAVLQALLAALGFSVGGMLPLLSATFIKLHMVRLTVVAAVTVALMVFGGAWAKLVRAPMGISCLLLIVWAWLSMAANFGFQKLVDSHLEK